MPRLSGFAKNFWQGFKARLQPRACFEGSIMPLLYQNFRHKLQTLTLPGGDAPDVSPACPIRHLRASGRVRAANGGKTNASCRHEAQVGSSGGALAMLFAFNVDVALCTSTHLAKLCNRPFPLHVLEITRGQRSEASSQRGLLRATPAHHKRSL